MTEDDTTEKVLNSENDAQEVADILSAVSEHVPKLLSEITEALFSAEKSEAFAESVAKFYKSLIDAGMDEEKAFELTQKFMEDSSPGGMISKVLGEVGEGSMNFGGKSHDQVGDEIEKKIKEKVKRKFEDE